MSGHAAAGTARDELRVPHDAVWTRAVAQLVEHEAHGVASLLVERLPHGSERRQREACLFDVVEAHHGDLIRNANSARRKLVEDSQRHAVVRGGDGADLFGAQASLVQENAHRCLSAGPLEVALDYPLRRIGDPVLLEHVAVNREPTLGLRIRLRPAHEGDAFHSVNVHEVLENGAHPDLVVDANARHAVELDSDAAERHRLVALAVFSEPRQPRAFPDGSRKEDEGVDVLWSRQVEHAVAIAALVVGRVEHTADEAQQVGATVVRRVHGSAQNRPLIVTVVEAVDEEPDAGRGPGNGQALGCAACPIAAGRVIYVGCVGSEAHEAA